MLAIARTYALLGVEASEVRVEADVRLGIPSFALVGLPDAAVREARERVRAAIVNSGFQFPQRRITTNLAPADLRKAGPGFDLALAAAVLAASEQLDPASLEGIALAGELALDGAIRPVSGALAMAQAAARDGSRALVVAAASAPEAALIGGVGVVGLDRLEQLRALGGEDEPKPPPPLVLGSNGAPADSPDLADLRGQPFLAHALEVTAAGGHSLLVVGPPGAGKSMAARRLPSLLPPLDSAEAIEAIKIASASGRPLAPLAAGVRPFRAPHHSVSTAGLLGGGSPPRPGEISLAHRGVLFLDELCEFRRDTLEALRQPLEDGRVLIARVRHSVDLPCRFQLVAAANPCPCGHGAGAPECECPEPSVRRYASKLTGALADRIDISVRVAQPSRAALAGSPSTCSAAVRRRVLTARERQAERLGPGRVNAEMSDREARTLARLDRAASRLLVDGLGSRISGRGFERLIRVARTLADLGAAEAVAVEHVEGAIALRGRAVR
ncbi:MAG: YifB family Mg chelatase-like AAA ATPase [Solirubrobacterales bacterium]|nr:YifB family Mg chelatase-like AAA ATPase [Solirubrobacterales bacterium]